MNLVGAAAVEQGAEIALTWSDGLTERLPAFWAVEVADATMDPGSRHRLTPLQAHAPDARVLDVSLAPEGLTVVLDPGGGAFISRARLAERRRLHPPTRLWARADALGPVRNAEHFLDDDKTLAETLADVRDFGLARLSGGEPEPGYLERIAARFGFSRETNYGRLFDVRSEARPTHLAYSPVALALHTDNPYRDPLLGLQLLHGIRCATSGGRTRFVDGFAAAEDLRQDRPERFEILARTAMDFVYQGPDRARLEARRPLIDLRTDGSIRALAFNHRALDLIAAPAVALSAWRKAYGDLDARLHDPERALDMLIEPGAVVIFDNLRVLHGRTAIEDAVHGRWLQGCYVDRDGLEATLARLSAS